MFNPKDQVLKEGFGINPDDSYQAFKQFKKVAEFWGNENCTPCFHYVTAFTGETATTAEKAMELTTAIFKDITDSHLAATGTHFKDREWNLFFLETNSFRFCLNAIMMYLDLVRFFMSTHIMLYSYLL